VTAASDIDGKLTTLGDAVERFAHDGAVVALGGFTINRNPMAFVYEMARRRVRGLHLVAHSNGQGLDTLVGAGCVSRIEVAYGGNGRFAPTCVRFRRAVERGEVAVEDYSNYHMALRFLAGALNVPFIPTKSGLHTDLVARQGFSAAYRAAHGLPDKKLIVMPDPFDDGGRADGALDEGGRADEASDRRGPGGDVVLLPALTPDLTVLHAQTVGDDGTVRIKGLTFADLEQAKASKAVVVTCEEIVPAATLRADPDQNALPPFLVDAVVCVPHGAHPTACRFFYDYDPGFLNSYARAARDDQAWATFLDEWVYSVADHDEYLAKIGAEQLARIKADPVRGYAIGLDRR
jgi:glutaconate CoA-transferase subunit A